MIISVYLSGGDSKLLEIDTAAYHAGQSRNQWIRSAIEERLHGQLVSTFTTLCTAFSGGCYDEHCVCGGRTMGNTSMPTADPLEYIPPAA